MFLELKSMLLERKVCLWMLLDENRCSWRGNLHFWRVTFFLEGMSRETDEVHAPERETSVLCSWKGDK
jgi:hypothetical protein